MVPSAVRDKDLKIRRHHLESTIRVQASANQEYALVVIEISQNQDIDRDERNNAFCFAIATPGRETEIFASFIGMAVN